MTLTKDKIIVKLVKRSLIGRVDQERNVVFKKQENRGDREEFFRILNAR
jgi:hypothetical protein